MSLWIDVAGPPGAGKSTICDPIWGHRAIDWDGKLPPAEWEPFLDEISALFNLIRNHPTLEAAVRMNRRSVRKMATVARMESERPYIQTGFIQRITGFGWRLVDMGCDVNLIRPALWRMPVSLGAAFLTASPEEITRRNHARKLVPATAHEDRAHMIAPMLPAIAVAKEVLRERGVKVIEIDVEHQTPDAAREHLVAFAGDAASHAPARRSGDQVQVLRSAPTWW